ncbi:MAG TPA: MBL fold metallo-hydrolase [Nocardioides sp.]|nr:MBL fold metallo-hydrolase [Nocardioides sp.]
MELTFLDARQGDAIWVRWGQGRQLLVDMGTSGTGRALADRFRALPEDQRAFELLVVTHVDTDHIGGVLTGLVDPDEPVPVTFADVWFNGWEHLNGLVPADERSELEPMGGVQGELLTTWLRDHAWNDAFGRAAVIRTDTTLPRVELPDGLAITVLAPVQERLTDLVPEWQLAVAAALEKGTLTEVSPGLEPMGPSTAPTLESAVDLALLSEDPFKVDGSKANAASIALVLEHDGKRALLTGDATASELLGGLALLGAGERVPLDLVKLPHHGSRNNVSRELVQAVDCPLWVFSSDGTTFRHPDAIAVSRVVRDSGPEPHLVFNVPSTFNQWWERAEWQDLFGYTTTYGVEDDGVTVALS